MLPAALHFYKPESLAFGKQIDLMVLKNVNEMQISQAGISYIYFCKVRISALLKTCLLQKLHLSKFKYF